MQSKIDELLVDWEIARQEGRDLSPEQLCAQCPELIDELKLRLRELSSTSWLFDETMFPGESGIETFIDRELQSPQQLIEAVITSGLLNDPAIERLKNEIATPEFLAGASVEELGKKIVEAGLLTAWQTAVLAGREQGPLKLDRYLVLDKIGAGGMGVVYRARHTSMNREVALKVLPGQFVASDDRRARFFREIKAVSQVSHPNIVTAYDSHEEDDNCFLAMELIDGDDLAEVIRESGPMPSEQAIEIMLDTCSAVEAAHDAGIVHRDIKPSNILLSNEGTAKLLDLGLARWKQQSIDESFSESDLTGTGMPMGTISYMSPEQALDASTAGVASDIYSLGCTWYYLLTGKPPFDGRGPVQTLMAHRETPVDEILDEHDFDQQVRNCLARMLAKNPAERFSSVREIRNVLESLRAGTDVDIQVPAPAASQKKPTRLIPWLAASAGLIGLLIGTWLLFQGGNDNPSGPGEQTSSQKDVARWILNEGGYVTAETEFGREEIDDLSALPAGSISVREAYLPDGLTEKQLGIISDLPDLELLSMDSCNFNTVDPEAIGKMPSLKQLALYDCRLSAKFWDALLKNTDLSSLALSGCSVTVDDVETICRLGSLRNLSLNNNELDNSIFEHLPALKNLETLDIAYSNIDVAETIRFIADWQRIRILNLSGNPVADDEFEDLPVARSLKAIQLDYTYAGDRAAAYIAGLPGIEQVYLEGTEVTDHGIWLLLDAAGTILSLDFAYTNTTEEALENLKDFTHLRQLNLSGLEVNDRQLNHITDIETLTHLFVAECPLTDRGLDKLTPMQLKALDITGCEEISVARVDQFLLDNPNVIVFTEK
ncbi:MAG: protein kinase [Planctomycetota bacterium]